MLEFFYCVSVLFNVATVSLLILISRRMTRNASTRPFENQQRSLPAFSQVGLEFSELRSRALEGLHFALAISEDADLDPFGVLLKKALEDEDAEVTKLKAGASSYDLVDWWKNQDGNDYDVLIYGSVVSKGYRTAFLEATLEYKARNISISPTVARPPSGDSQENLAIAVTSYLKREIDQALTKLTRYKALEELRAEIK